MADDIPSDFRFHLSLLFFLSQGMLVHVIWSLIIVNFNDFLILWTSVLCMHAVLLSLILNIHHYINVNSGTLSTPGQSLRHKVKTQYVHFRLRTNYFLLSWKIPEEISR